MLGSNEDLVAVYEAGFSPSGVQSGGFKWFISVSVEVEKPQSAAFPGFELDLQDLGSFLLKIWGGLW